LAGKRAPAVKQSFSIAAPPTVVWERFGDVPAMIRCIPGASLVSQESDGTYQIKIRIKMGPIGAEFAGVARQERDDATLTGIINGSGRDSRSGTLAEGTLCYRLVGEDEGTSTRADIEVGYQLSGALAQFARAGIVTHFVGAITNQFAENLRRSLSPSAAGGETIESSELRIASSFFGALRAWLASLLRTSGK
jgi:carbon-monoxide dehydrogenase small subunit